MTDVYPLRFKPIYKPKIWGGRNLERIFGRRLPPGEKIGESWELADLAEGVSLVANGPAAGARLTELTSQWADKLLGKARPLANGRFPLLLKLLDAEERLSLQVHPDARAAAEIGPPAVLKTECWYVIESRGGAIYKGVKPGIGAKEFRDALERDDVESLVRRVEVSAGDFHYLPAGTVHAIGGRTVIAEVQTPSDTTYRVTDWQRGREIHVERSLQCIRFELTEDLQPGAQGQTLLVTDYFTVAKGRGLGGQKPVPMPAGRLAAVMLVACPKVGDSSPAPAEIRHAGTVEPRLPVRPGDTILLPAGLTKPELIVPAGWTFLVVTLPESR